MANEKENLWKFARAFDMSHNTTDNEEETDRSNDIKAKNEQWKMLASKVSDGRSVLDSLQVEFSSFDISKGKTATKCPKCDEIQCECHWTPQGTAKNFMEQGNDETGTTAANMIDQMEAVLEFIQNEMIDVKTAIAIIICREEDVFDETYLLYVTRSISLRFVEIGWYFLI